MKRLSVYFFLTLFSALSAFSQIIVALPKEETSIDTDINPLIFEHGFLPGKEFPIFPAVHKYDFRDLKFRVELYDYRDSLHLRKVNCSETPITNGSEFADPDCILKFRDYLDSLFHQSGAVVDTASRDTMQIYLEAIDVRLLGFISIRVHGLCQIKIKYENTTKTYCIDIKDGDKNAPLSRKAFTTRLTATRYMGSAAMREVIEQFFDDLTKAVY